MKDLKDKSVEELRQIAADLKAKRAPSVETEANPKEDLNAELASLPVDHLTRIRDSLKERLGKAVEPEAKGNRYEGMARSGLRAASAVPILDVSAAEPLVSGVKAAAETLSSGNASGESTKDMVKRFVKNYKDERALGEDYQKQFPANEMLDTARRSAVSSATAGISEPIVSGARAVEKTVKEEGFSGLINNLDALKRNYDTDVRDRNKSREKLPELDIASQAAGAFFMPSGGLRKGGALVLTKYAPNLLSKGQAAIAKFFTENPTVMKKVIQEGASILGGAVKAGTDIAEAQIVRNEVLDRGGFEDPKDQINPISAGVTGAKFGGAVSSVPVLGKALGAASKWGVSAVLGPDAQAIEHYLANIDRLKGQNPTVAKLADEINESVTKIKSDFANKQLSQAQAKEAVDKLDRTVRENFYGENQTLRNELSEAKRQLDLSFREEKAMLDSFKRSLPERHFEDVSASVEEVRNQAKQSKQVALGVLAGSKEKIPLGKAIVELEDGSEVSLPGVLDQLKAIRKSYNIKGKEAFGVEARAAQSRIDDYMQQISKMGDSVSASKLRNMVDQLDDDIQAIGSITGIAGKSDATLMALRANLDQRLAVVPGWSEAIGMARDSAQALGRVSKYIKQPEDIVSFLRNAGADDNFLGRDVLHELGQRTGKDFTGISDEAKMALSIARSPRAMDGIKQELPEAQRVRDLQQQLDGKTNPYELERRVSKEVEGSDQWLKLKQAEQEVNDVQKTHDMFKNWNEQNLEEKIKTMINGKEALKRNLGTLGQLSDKEFVQAIDDLRTMIQFRKQYKVGSRNVNLFGAMGNAMATGNNRAASIGVAAAVGGLIDSFGPRMARQVLNQVANVNGMITVEKLNNLALPEFIKKELANQYTKALYYGANSPKPHVTVGPEEAAAIRMEIQRSKLLSNVEKARQLSNLNKYGQVDTTKVLLGGQEAPVLGPNEEPNQIDAEDSDEELYRQPPALPEIMSRLKDR